MESDQDIPVSKQQLALIGLVIGVVVVGGAAAFGVLPSVNENAGSSQVPAAIPGDAQAVVAADPVGFIEDPVTRDLGNYVLQDLQESGQSYTEALDSVRSDYNTQIQESLSDAGFSDINLQLSDVGDIALYSNASSASLQNLESVDQLEEGEEVGVVIELGLTQDEVQSLASESESWTDSGTYNEHTVYEISSQDENTVYFAVLEDGLHVAGNEEAVRSVIDTYEGNTASTDLISEDNFGGNTYLLIKGTNLSEDEFNSLQNPPTEYTISYSTNGDDQVMVNTEYVFDDGEAASQFQTQIQGQVDQFARLTGQSGNVDVSTTGDTVSVDYNAGVQDVEQIVGQVYSIFQQSFSGGGTVGDGSGGTSTGFGG